MQNVQRLVLYVGALLLAVGTLRDSGLRRAAEPALAAGAAIVIGYGLSGRLLPDLIDLDSSRSAGGRLEQPLTYWNAEGALAAIGLVLCARLAGDRSRPRARVDRRRRVPRARGGPLSLVLARRARGRGPRPARARRARALTRAAARRRRRAASRGAVRRRCIELLPDRGLTLLAVLIAAGAVTAFLVARTGDEPPEAPRWYSRLRRWHGRPPRSWRPAWWWAASPSGRASASCRRAPAPAGSPPCHPTATSTGASR